jgi:hypothetical protein
MVILLQDPLSLTYPQSVRQMLVQGKNFTFAERVYECVRQFKRLVKCEENLLQQQECQHKEEVTCSTCCCIRYNNKVGLTFCEAAAVMMMTTGDAVKGNECVMEGSGYACMQQAVIPDDDQRRRGSKWLLLCNRRRGWRKELCL